MFNRKILILVFIVSCIYNSNAQLVGIGTTAPDASSVLDLTNSAGGLLIPRFTLANRNTLDATSPFANTGMLIYQTTNTPGFYYNAGTPAAPVWTYVNYTSFWGDPPRMGFWGPSGTIIISNTELSWDTIYSRIGVGTIAPSSKLNVIGTSDNVLLKVTGNASQLTDIMRISDGNTGTRFFTFDNNGRMVVRGIGVIALNNIFHLTAYNGAPTPSVGSSFFEIDCDNTTGNELVIRLSESNATNSPDLWLNFSGGTVTAPTNLTNGDDLSFFFANGRYNGGWGYLTNIISNYRGNSSTQIADMTFHTLTGGGTTYKTERMRINPNGEVGINTTTLTAGNTEKFRVNSTTTTVNNTKIYGNIDDMLRIGIQNQSAGTDASSDMVATADNGTETTNYINLGTNSSGYTTAAYSITAANDGYLYNVGNNLDIGTGYSSIAKSIKFFTGGTLSSNERMCITSNGKVGIGTTSPAASAIVEISSTTAGFLVPRMTTAQRTGIGSLATGLVVYQTDGTPGFYYYQAGWNTIASSSTSYLAGNGLTLTGNTFSLNLPFGIDSGGTENTTFPVGYPIIGAGTSALTTNANLYWDNTTLHLGIGTTQPTESLTVNGTTKLGIVGSVITNVIRATVNINANNIVAGGYDIQYVVVTGADTNSRVLISPSAALSTGIVISSCGVHNTDTVEVIFNNVDVAVNPPALNFYITVFH